jgi:hypothetical protein
LAAQKNRVGIWSLEQPADEVSRFIRIQCCDPSFISSYNSLCCHDRQRLPRLRLNPRWKLLRSE